MNKPFVLGAVAVVLFALGLALVLEQFPGQIAPAVIAVFASVPASLITAGLIYLLQKPDFEVVGEPFVTLGHRPGEKISAVTGRWIHVSIRNISTGLLGGGTASGVYGLLRFDPEKPGEGSRVFRTKWEAKDNPVGQVSELLSPNIIQTTLYGDRFRIPTVREEVLAAKEAKSLDIAVKWTGNPNAYVWDPMVFETMNFSDPRVALGPGEHRFDLCAVWGGNEHHLGKFSLGVGAGDGPESLTLKRIK